MWITTHLPTPEGWKAELAWFVVVAGTQLMNASANHAVALDQNASSELAMCPPMQYVLFVVFVTVNAATLTISEI